MKKTYISPSVKFMVCDMKSSLLEGSDLNGKTLGKEYNSEDVSYTNEGNDFYDIWDVK